jgi:hypothetical protein
MRIVRFGAGLVVLLLGAQALAAQQPGPPRQQHRRPDSSTAERPAMAEQMRMMDSLNARLDTLVSRMNRAAGTQKVSAMADVINELVAQRKMMQKHMHQMMMGDSQGMMHMMGKPQPAEPRAPKPRTDSAPADTAGHAGHHPPN